MVKKRGREYLIKELKKRGVSRRRSVRGMNLVFSEIKNALARGEEVELGWGKLKAVRQKHRPQTVRFLNRELTTYKQPFTVVLETDRKGERRKAIGDEPMPPDFVGPIVDDEGERPFEGEERTLYPEGWSRNQDNCSFADPWAPQLEPLKKPVRVKRKRQRVNKRAETGK